MLSYFSHVFVFSCILFIIAYILQYFQILDNLQEIKIFNLVAEHVGSRTQDECIMNFLKLPIEDPYIDGKKLAGNDGNYDFMPLPFRFLKLSAYCYLTLF